MMGEDEFGTSAADCGIEGDPQAFVTHASFNRFVRIILASHMIPIHRDMKALKRWNLEADITVAKIQGGIVALKMLGYVVLLTISGTFAATVWMMTKLVPP